jgi:hypothetical protein
MSVCHDVVWINEHVRGAGLSGPLDVSG